MYFARNNDLEKYKLYLSFFDNVSDNKANSEKYTEFLNKIIVETHKLSNNEIGYSNISREIFDIVSLLNLNHKEYFKTIHVDNIEREVYEKVSSFIKSDIDAY